MDSNQESIFTLVVIILNIYRDTSDAVLPRFQLLAVVVVVAVAMLLRMSTPNISIKTFTSFSFY